MGRDERSLRKILLEHIAHDDERFGKIQTNVAVVKGMLSILIVLVVSSGLLNYFQVH